MNKTFVYFYEKDETRNLYLSDNALDNEDFVLGSITGFKVDKNDPSIYVFQEGTFQYSQEFGKLVRVV